MNVILSLTESQTLADLRAFLLAILPSGTEVILAQPNRVPEPQVDNFVVMTPTRRARLATNINSYDDCAFTGSIAALVLTVTEVQTGVITPGDQVLGSGIVNNTIIGAQLTGSVGGIGTYEISPSQTFSSGLLVSGTVSALQKTDVTIQIDLHGPASADNTQIVTTLFRDQTGVAFFDALGHGVSPLYADEGKQMPFFNEEQQAENRWVVEARLQVNPTVTIVQQFADVLAVGIISVEAEYPASP